MYTYLYKEFGAYSADEIKEGSKALHDVLELDVPKMLKEKADTVSSPKTSTVCDRCARNLYH